MGIKNLQIDVYLENIELNSGYATIYSSNVVSDHNLPFIRQALKNQNDCLNALVG